MDILSHTLWAAAGATVVKRKFAPSFPVRATAFFGVFPDLFAFTALFFWIIGRFFLGHFGIPELPALPIAEPVSETAPILRVSAFLYTLSHSAVVFVIVAAIAYLSRRRVPWSLSGWLLHIVIDIFTHSYHSYPTPVLWPISVWKFNGLPWHEPWFMLVNYAALAGAYLGLFEREQFRAVKERCKDFLIQERSIADVRLAVGKIREGIARRREGRGKA